MSPLSPAVRAAAAFLAAAGVAASAAGFDLQGHRGARGLAPENTLAAFRTALALGVTTIETDVGVTRDGVVVIAHDRTLNPDLVRGPDGRWLATRGPAIHALTFEELLRYDVGRVDPASRYAAEFPAQRPVDGERFPRLADLFALAGTAAPRVRFNVETKLAPDAPDETPDPATFARAVVDAVRAARMERRVTIQSFDWRTLVEVRRLAPAIATSCLTIETERNDNVGASGGRPSPWTAGLSLADHAGSVPRLVKAAGCATWSPFWRNMTAARVREARALGLAVVPWTVNNPSEMNRLIELGVDGLITDYPNRLRKVLGERGIALPR